MQWRSITAAMMSFDFDQRHSTIDGRQILAAAAAAHHAWRQLAMRCFRQSSNLSAIFALEEKLRLLCSRLAEAVRPPISKEVALID